MDKIARIRQEIERQMKFYDEKEMKAWDDSEYGDEDALWYQGHRKMCAKLLTFLDTLSEEPDKSLEEEYKDYVENDPVYSKLVNRYAGLGIARHFAEWQKNQMPMPEDTVLFNKGVAEGRRLEREDMLKDAMEGQIYGSDGDHWIESEIYENLKGKEGDKVSIVVLKEEEK